MREFYLAYRDLPKVQPLVAQIGWTHNLTILQRCKAVLPGGPGQTGARRGGKPVHRHHPLQGEGSHDCRVCLARCPQTHRRGHLPVYETFAQGAQRPVAHT